MLASERGNALREQVLAFCRDQGLGAWDRRDQQGFLRNLVVREGRRTGQFQVRLVTSPGKLDAEALTAAVDCDGLFWTQTAGLGESTQRGETARLAGHRHLHESLCGPAAPDLARGVLPDQHRDGRGALRRRVELAGLRGHERVFDLYCGIGTIGLSLAARAREIVGVEIIEPAVADAIENARRNEVTNASFFAGDIRLAMRELVERAGRPDVASSTRRAPASHRRSSAA